MPDVFQESLRMIPAKAAKLERLIAESRVIDKTNTSKIMQVIGYGEVIVKVGKDDETTYSCLNDLLKQNSKEKFIIINRMITTSPGLRVPLHEGIYLAQQKNPDRGYVVKKSPGRYGADVLNMYPGYSVKFANLNQATKAYDLNKATKANENSRVKATQKKHGMNLLTAFFEPSKKKAVKVTPN
jgi:porphobilinogen deaminase